MKLFLIFTKKSSRPSIFVPRKNGPALDCEYKDRVYTDGGGWVSGGATKEKRPRMETRGENPYYNTIIYYCSMFEDI